MTLKIQARYKKWTIIHAATFFALEAGFVVVLDRGLPATFPVEVSFFAGAFALFVAAIFAFAPAVEPVTAFFAGARLDAVVVFFTGPALALPASVFFGGAGFLAVGTFAAAGFFLVGPVTVFVASLALVFEAGLEFSLAAPVLTLGANLTLPEGPLGKTKTPFSAPTVIARFN